MLADMATRKAKREEHEEPASLTVSTRLTPEELRKLDDIAEESPYQPSRSQLIAHAVREFLKQHGVRGQK